MTLAPGDRASRFLRVPWGASRLKVRAVQREESKNHVTVALGSIDAWRRQEDRIRDSRMDLECCVAKDVTASVMPGTIEEIVAFSHWPANTTATVDLEARFEGPVSPDSSLVAGPGEDVVLLRLASPLAPFRGRVTGRLDRIVERPPVSKETVPDPRGEPVFAGDLLYVCRQRFEVRVAPGESVRVVPLSTRALDEQREDARWKILDAAGRVVRRAVIDWTFDFDGLPAGLYAVEYETPTWGRAAADAGITGFELHRSMGAGEQGVSVYPTADLAADGTGGDADVDLRPGAVRSVAVRLPGLEAGRAYSGSVEVREGDEVRLSLPLRVDRTTSTPPTSDVLQDRLVQALREEAQRVADDPDASVGDPRRSALEKVRRALGFKPDDRGLRLLDVRLSLEFAIDAPARADVAKKVEALLAGMDRKNGGDRADIGRVLLARSRLHRAEGRKLEADADFAECRFLLPDNDPAVLQERVALGDTPGGDLRDALAAARSLSEANPASFNASFRVARILVRLGWGIPAAAEARRWPERFPSRMTEFRSSLAEIRAAGGDPAPRTLAQLRSAAP